MTAGPALESQTLTPQRMQGARRSELEFRKLLEQLPVAAYTCDRDGLITYFNRRAGQLWRREPRINDPADRFCGSFRLFLPDGTPIRHEECWMALALSTDRGYNGREIVIECPDGERVSALAHANPLHDESGRLVGAVNVLVDITDRRKAERSLQEGERRRNEFLATLGHELRGPLAPIRNAVDLLATEVGSSAARWALGVLDRQTRHLARLVDDLLDVTRLTQNRIELQPGPVTVSEVVFAALETTRPEIESRAHTITVDLPSHTLSIVADRSRLAQALSNLLNNAARYSGRGGQISVSARAVDGELRLAVSDSGTGIAPDRLPHIFELFSQGNGDSHHEDGGPGIGLALSRQLVEMHGGRIEAHSEGIGRGSQFVIHLPLNGTH